jgi:hypothetical protein
MAILKRQEHLWPVLWAGMVILLVAIISLEYFFGQPGEGEAARAPAKIVEAKLLPDFSLPAEGELAPETAARPLFVPTRRPAPPVAVAAAAEMKRGQFTLTGVTVAPDASFAFLKEVATGKTRSIKQGAQVNGMTVDTIEARRIVLKQGEETEVLSLYIGVPPPPVAPPAQGGFPTPAGAPPGAPPAPPPNLTIPGFPAVPVNPRSAADAGKGTRQSVIRHQQ